MHTFLGNAFLEKVIIWIIFVLLFQPDAEMH